MRLSRSSSRSSPQLPYQAEPEPEPESVSVARQLTAQQRLTAAVGPLIKADGGHLAVAVDDLTSGTEAVYGTSEFVTARCSASPTPPPGPTAYGA
jgi:hypothetical protein